MKKSLMSLIFFPVVEMISFFAWSGTTMSGIIQCGMGSSHLPIFGKKFSHPFVAAFSAKPNCIWRTMVRVLWVVNRARVLVSGYSGFLM